MKLIVMATVTLGLAAGASLAQDSRRSSSNYPDYGTGNCPDDGTLRVEGAYPDIRHQHWVDRRSGVAPVVFRVYDGNEALVRTSRSGSLDLPPGRYLVRFADSDSRNNAFWATVEPGKTTCIDRNRAPSEDRKMRAEERRDLPPGYGPRP